MNLFRDFDRFLPRYQYRLKLIDLPFLRHRRAFSWLISVHKLHLALIDVKFLQGYVYITVSSKLTRSFRPLRLPICKSNYSQHDPFRVISKSIELCRDRVFIAFSAIRLLARGKSEINQLVLYLAFVYCVQNS